MGLHSRKDYTQGTLDVSDLIDGPWALLKRWVEAAVSSDFPDPTAFTLSTSDAEGCPNGRIVLLREIRDDALVFFTNYNSEKGRNITRHPMAGATFFWPYMERQIRLKGRVGKISSQDSDAYFASRPRASQIGAWSSDQSASVTGRGALDDAFERRVKEFEGRDVPRPPHWGGFALCALEMEFWQGRASRMHDRIHCKLEGGGWTYTRLQP